MLDNNRTIDRRTRSVIMFFEVLKSFCDWIMFLWDYDTLLRWDIIGCSEIDRCPVWFNIRRDISRLVEDCVKCLMRKVRFGAFLSWFGNHWDWQEVDLSFFERIRRDKTTETLMIINSMEFAILLRRLLLLFELELIIRCMVTQVRAFFSE